MIIISHRGNINGPNKDRENSIEYIVEAAKAGYQVEVDVRIINSEIWLGHDGPQYLVDFKILESIKDVLWCHAKNINALEFLLKNNFHVFWHQTDDYTLTSKGIIWAYPGFHATGIYVMPELDDTIIDSKCLGVCTDYPLKFLRK